ncbi:MAG: alpha/beta hydrolase [Alphaproteobacteria bacterium]|nr:alpha/beta hydrolase [Alphaproteobacteria bacterium]
MRLSLLALFCLVIFSGEAFAAPCDAPDNRTRVTAGTECLLIRTYGKKGETGPRTLYVLLHGNHSDGSPGTSMYRVAKPLAEQASANSVAVAILRPGYNDDEGNFSTGERSRIDNWTAPVIDAIADAIARLKDFHKPDRLVLIGHSGGSAVTGVILGRHPGLADAALLIGCVCDVQTWRVGRSSGTWFSESPSTYIERIPKTARIIVLAGGGDTVTLPSLSQSYVDRLKASGIETELLLDDSRSHTSILASPLLIESALRLGAIK